MDVRLKLLKPARTSDNLVKHPPLSSELEPVSKNTGCCVMPLTFLLLFSDHLLPLGALVVGRDQKRVALQHKTDEFKFELEHPEMRMK